MGTWDIGTFDNDTACDWAYELEKSSDLSVIEKSINVVFEEDDMDADYACEALAAIDTIIRLIGKQGVINSYTEIVDHWVKRHQEISVPKALIEKAQKAISLILSENSELYELWLESEHFDAWKADVQSLANRLST